jgi:hypothetical protein
MSSVHCFSSEADGGDVDAATRSATDGAARTTIMRFPRAVFE